MRKENEQLKEKIIEYQNNIFKIHHILDDIKLNNKDTNNPINKSLEELNKIVSQLINNNIDNLIKDNNNIDIQNDDKNIFNLKIQDIIKEKNENLIKIANTLNNVQLIKKQYKNKNGENKFINKFINVDK